MHFHRLHLCVFTLMGIMLFSTLGYWVVEDMPLFDALYMTVITISTVGFGEIHPLTTLGRSITMITIMASITIGGYAASEMMRILIGGELRRSFERRKVEHRIAQLTGHFIICGYGRIGSIICRELSREGMSFVVIEQDPAAVEPLAKAGHPHLQMDATSEEALVRAGIMKARGLVTAVSSDANNVFITLTAKGLRPDIFVLSRTSDLKNEEKLKRAGATRVVSPYYLGAKRMAQVLKRPTVVDFIDVATMGTELALTMEEGTIRANGGLVGKNLVDSHLRRDFGVIIVAIKKPTGRMIFNPMPTEILEAGDVLVVIGKRDDVARMNETL